MRKILFILILLACELPFLVSAQEIAVTERGDSVVLYSNGTWDYYSNYVSEEEGAMEIRENKESFKKPASSTEKITIAKNAFELWYDNKKWKRTPPGEINEDADLSFKYNNGDVYAVLIHEELEIPIDNILKIALDNAISVAPDAKIVDTESREVNGAKMVLMRMNGTVSGIQVAYYSYYFSNEKGTIQFHTMTGQNLLSRYKNDIEDLLNGLIVEQ